ncbi:MAG TPA: PIN domain-containing protein [Actinomycetes bacterium]|nr:PIN domain-containing protein [Actinomycetes bacterium]
MIRLDTSGLFALRNRRDPAHAKVRKALISDPGPYLVPAGILGEITYLLERRYGVHTLDAFLADLESGTFRLECGDNDFGRVRALVERYADLPLGLAEAAVIACAERSGGAVLTLDRRDFGVVAREGKIAILPRR